MNTQTTISEDDLVERFNAELAARADARRLIVNRTTKLGDFVMQGDGGPRLWLRAHEFEWLSRRNGILSDSEAVQFNRVPMQGRAYAPT